MWFWCKKSDESIFTEGVSSNFEDISTTAIESVAFRQSTPEEAADQAFEEIQSLLE